MMKEPEFYDELYYVSQEQRYYFGAHGERVRDIVAFLPSGRRILDYGAGAGYFAHQAALRGNDVTAYDFSPSATKFIASRYPRVRVVGREEELQGRYEAVMLIDVIEHLEYADQAPFLRRLTERLAPGGRLIVATDNIDSFFEKNRLGRKLQSLDQRLTREGAVYRSIKMGEGRMPYRRRYTDSHVGLLGRDRLIEVFAEAGLTLKRERHGFFYRSPVSWLVSRLFGLRPLHSVYLFERAR
jgi:2-polyprenyl-3-methyl-5-hydroxy-6-metoxy-1,4-benzoquinol methylase